MRAKQNVKTAQSKRPIGQQEPLAGSLKSEVKHALLNVLRDPTASAAAKASAGRTLLEHFDDAQTTSDKRRGADMSAADLDAAIADLEQ